jgi:tRNA (mo5U34)-methyltransferase
MVPGIQLCIHDRIPVIPLFDSFRESSQGCDWMGALGRLAETRWQEHSHGDLPRWCAALAGLPDVTTLARLDQAMPDLGQPVADPETLSQQLMAFHPWRKGPVRLGGVEILTEWRSDWKWDRVAPHIDLTGHRVLDIGSGNGYFGLRMLGAGAKCVVGIDPTILFVMQSLVCRHFSGGLQNYVLPLAVEDLPDVPVELDTVFSMGVLYHRKEALHHLERIHALLKRGGTMVLETLVLPAGREGDVLIPENRYARMRNVWAVPGSGRLLEWVEQAGFRKAEVVDVTPTTTLEQKTTKWMSFESLEQSLDPADQSQTVEGLPAPVRAIVIART